MMVNCKIIPKLKVATCLSANLVVVTLILAVTSCRREAEKPPSSQPTIEGLFFVAKGASNLVYQDDARAVHHSIHSLTYDLDSDWPSLRFLSDSAQFYRSKGWYALSHDLDSLEPSGAWIDLPSKSKTVVNDELFNTWWIKKDGQAIHVRTGFKTVVTQ
jgi:hypothetical protein